MAVYMKSVLYPPTPNAPTPTLRERPPGCKTIFIGKIFFWQYWKDLGYSLHGTGSNLLLFMVHVPSASLLKIVAVPTFLIFVSLTLRQSCYLREHQLTNNLRIFKSKILWVDPGSEKNYPGPDPDPGIQTHRYRIRILNIGVESRLLPWLACPRIQ